MWFGLLLIKVEYIIQPTEDNFNVYQSPISDFGGASSNGNLSFKDSNTGLIIDNNSTVYKSINAGANWNTVTTSGTVYNVGLCYIEGTDTVFSTGSAGSSYSEDGGTSWNLIDDIQHTSVEFKNPITGWSGFFNESSTSKGIWKWENTSNLSADFEGVPTTICTGNVVNFSDKTTGGTPTSWNWSFPGGSPSSSTISNPSITYNTAGTYNVTLTVDDGSGPNSKVITDYITVNGVPAQPSAISGNTSPSNGSVEVYAVTNVYGVTYAWELPVGWTGTSTTNSISVTVGSNSGVITVTPSNSCGIGQARTLNVTVLGVDDIKNPSIEIYPNPATENLYISLPDKMKLKIINIIGQEVFVQQNFVSGNINVSGFDRGVYVMILSNEKGIVTKKIILE